MKNHKSLSLWGAAIAAGVAFSLPLVAGAGEGRTHDPLISSDGEGGAQSVRSNQQAGMVGEDRSKKEYKKDDSKKDGALSLSMMSEEQKGAKMSLAPHAVMIESSLMSAMDGLKGLRAQLKISEEATPPQEYVKHFKMFGKEINSDVKKADVHSKELQGSVQKYPEVASSDDLSKVKSDFNDLIALNSDWQSKVARNDYWKDKNTVLKDLDLFEKRLSKTLDDTKSFNSSQLNISSIG